LRIDSVVAGAWGVFLQLINVARYAYGQFHYNVRSGYEGGEKHKLKNDCFKCPTSVAMSKIERSFGYKIKGTIVVGGTV